MDLGETLPEYPVVQTNTPFPVIRIPQGGSQSHVSTGRTPDREAVQERLQRAFASSNEPVVPPPPRELVSREQISEALRAALGNSTQEQETTGQDIMSSEDQDTGNDEQQQHEEPDSSTAQVRRTEHREQFSEQLQQLREMGLTDERAW